MLRESQVGNLTQMRGTEGFTEEGVTSSLRLGKRCESAKT